MYFVNIIFHKILFYCVYNDWELPIILAPSDALLCFVFIKTLLRRISDRSPVSDVLGDARMAGSRIAINDESYECICGARSVRFEETKSSNPTNAPIRIASTPDGGARRSRTRCVSRIPLNAIMHPWATRHARSLIRDLTHNTSVAADDETIHQLGAK